MTAVANSSGVLQVLDVGSEVGSSLFIFFFIGQKIQADKVKALDHLNPTQDALPSLADTALWKEVSLEIDFMSPDPIVLYNSTV